MILEKIRSGGQTGADLGGLRAGKSKGLPVGGMAPKGFLTENGPDPSLGTLYGVEESTSAAYPPRTRVNARDSDGTIRFAADFATAGEVLTLKLAREYKKPTIDVDVIKPIEPKVVADWIIENQIRVLNVAGNRESTYPGIGDFVANYLCQVIDLLSEA